MKRFCALVSVALLIGLTANAQMTWDRAVSLSKPGYVAVPSSPSLQFGGSITMECWVNPSDTVGDQSVLCKYSSGANGFALTLRASHILYEQSGGVRLGGKKSILPGVWTHLAVAYDSAAQTLTSYVNGAIDSLRIGYSSAVHSNIDSLLIGRYANSPSNTQFVGTLDEIRIWNRALSLSEILHNRFLTLSGCGSATNGLVLSLPFQYPTNTNSGSLLDYSGNNNLTIPYGNVSPIRVSTGPSLKLSPNVSAYFDGSGFLAAASSSNIKFSGSFTVQCWVHPDTMQTGIILQKRPLTGDAVGYTLYLSNNRPAFRVNNPTMAFSNHAIPSGVWSHIAGVYDDSAKVFALYVNGVLDTSTISSSNAPVASNDTLFVGTGYNGSFRGYIDDIRLSAAAWTPQQIAMYMGAGLDLWNKPAALPVAAIYSLDGHGYNLMGGGPDLRFYGTARFSNVSVTNGTPISPILRADGIGYPESFTLKASKRTIPSSGSIGHMVDDSLQVSTSVSISSLRLAVTINHTWEPDLTITLIGPAGDSVEVYHRAHLNVKGGVATIFSDAADSSLNDHNVELSWLPTVKPSTLMNGIFAGKNSAGIWRLRVADNSLGDSGRLYMWGLQFNNGSLTGVSGQPGSIPRKISLDQNYPNPFNPTTVISYHLPTAVSVNLTVYDVLGREVETLANGMQTPGDHSVRFEGRGLASGVYFYLLKAGAFSETKKMVLVR